MRTNKETSILDLLERLLDDGAVIKGDILLSVADVDLVYLNLELLLASMATLKQSLEKNPQKAFKSENSKTKANSNNQKEIANTNSNYSFSPIKNSIEPQELRSENNIIKTDINPKNLEKGLTKLVLALVNLLRKLMEQQALRKIEGGYVNHDEIERMGHSFMLLDQKITELRLSFGLKEDDLNLNLGPLGSLY